MKAFAATCLTKLSNLKVYHVSYFHGFSSGGSAMPAIFLVIFANCVFIQLFSTHPKTIRQMRIDIGFSSRGTSHELPSFQDFIAIPPLKIPGLNLGLDQIENQRTNDASIRCLIITTEYASASDVRH
jgi:hypothetical protein